MLTLVLRFDTIIVLGRSQERPFFIPVAKYFSL